MRFTAASEQQVVRLALAGLFFLAAGPLGARRAAGAGSFSVTKASGSVTVVHQGDPSWKAVVDRTHGGVVRHFSLPAEGPNLVAADDKEDGTTNPFRGMFNTFYMTRIDRGDNPEDRIKAKGTFWGKSDGTATLRLVAQDDDRVVVEAAGQGFGWRLLGPKDEPVVRYRQQYTFRPDRVVCEGELTWVYQHDTRLKDMSVLTFFAPDTVAYPLHATDARGREFELTLTTSKGKRFPEGLKYPLSLDVSLKNGYGLRFRSLGLPAALEDSRWYSFERPWQHDWAQSIAFEGDTELTLQRFPAGEPARYQYEMQIAATDPSQAPPRLTILSPRRETLYRPGQAVRFAASAVDGRGRSIPGESIHWDVYYPYNKLTVRHDGAELGHTVSTERRDYGIYDYLFAVATVTDGSGRKAQEYVKINVDLKTASAAPAKPFEWQAAAAESQGMSTARLEALWEGLKVGNTTGLIVVRNDRVVFERYAEGWDAARKHYTASMAKAVVGGVSLAVAVSDGRIALDDQAARFVPSWNNDPRKASITVRQLGSHTSGLDDAEEEGVPHEKLTGWKGAFWKPEAPPNDPFTIARDKVPLVFDPGQKMHYSNPGIAMLGYTITAALKDAPEKDLRSVLRDRVMRPIGVADQEWSVGYGKTVLVDGLPLVAAWGGGGYTPRAAARVCRLMLREGDWDGTRLIRADAVRQVTRDAGTPGTCGIGWWSNNEGVRRRLPRDAYYGSGAGHQIALVVPSLNLIAVRNGDVLRGAEYDEAEDRFLFEPLMDAVTDRGTLDPAASGATGPR